MIRNIIRVDITDVTDDGYHFPVDMIPASGTYRSETDEDDSGRYEKIDISFRTEQPHRLDDWFYRDLILTVHFSDGAVETVGNQTVPVRLKTAREKTFSASTEYVRPI